MCGRYSLVKKPEVPIEEPGFEPRFNIAPTQKALVLRAAGSAAEYLTWGLLPALAKSKGEGSKYINARAETIQEKPMFATSFQKRRCLVFADSFYEWIREEKLRQPVRIQVKNRPVFAFAGIWNETTLDGEAIKSFSI